MYILPTIVCLLSIIHINGVGGAPFSDEKPYNPCKTQAGLYYYPHRTNPHLYYQCDEPGNAYLRTCGDLVWDRLHTACNWPSGAVLSSTQANVAASSSSWSTQATPSASSLPDTTSPSTAAPVVTDSSSTTDSSSASLCKPVNPCGDHGDCIESPATIPDSPRRFACICSDDRFGRLCDKKIDDLTTPTTMISDQNRKLSATNDTIPFSATNATSPFPIGPGEDSKLIFYGLKAGNTVPTSNETAKPISP